MSLKIDWATHEAAKYACEKWHYSKCLPPPPHIFVGAWEHDKFIGVVVFSRGASSNLGKPYNLDQTQCCELTRIALNKHDAPVSKIMSLAIKFFKKKTPKMKLIVSFADPNQGHHGGIYQATNWLYTGKSADSTEYFDDDGNKYHSRQVSEKGFNKQYGNIRKTKKPSELTKVKLQGKHRYLMPLDEETRESVKSLSKPYPKRASSVESSTSGFQSEGGGESPTDALQLLDT